MGQAGRLSLNAASSPPARERSRLLRALGLLALAAPAALSVALPWPAAAQEAPAQRNFWDLREPAHTEEHAQGLGLEAAPPPDAETSPPEAPEADPSPPADTGQGGSAGKSPEPAPQTGAREAAPAQAAPSPPTRAAESERPAQAGPAAPPGEAQSASAEPANTAAPGAPTPGAAPAAGQQASQEAPLSGATAGAGEAPEGETADGAQSAEAEEEPQARSLDALYRLGRDAERRGDVRRATIHYQAVLRRAPYHLLTHVALGRLYLTRDPAAARYHLETARRVQPSSDAVHYLLGQAYEALGRPVDAAEAYRRAIHLNPRHYDANARLRRLLRDLRARRTVVERAAESFYAQPNLATLTLFGRLVMEHLSPREAVLEFEEVRRRQPELAEAELWLARARHAQGDLQAEVAAYRRYLEQRPKATGVRLLVVERLAEQGWYQSAATLLEPFVTGENGIAGGLPPQARSRVTFLRSRLLSAEGEPGRAGEMLLLAEEQGHEREVIAQAFAEDLALYPDAPALWFAYGNWLRAAERPGEAADALAQAGRLDEAHRRKARALLVRMAERREERGGAPVAARLALGELAWAEGDGDAALAALEFVPAGHALDHRAALLRGKIHRARGELDAALDAFTRYVFFFEDRRDVLYARGNLFWELGRKEEALAVWMRNPDVLLRHPLVLSHVAEHYRARGDAEQEIAVRERLARAVPGNQPNRVRLGELYAQQGRRMEAALLWERVLHERPRDADLLARTGKAWLALSERDRALPLLQRAAQLRALDPETSALLARELYRTHQYEEALQAYWALHEAQPGHDDLPRVLPELVLSLPATPEQRWTAARLAQEAGRLDAAAEVLEALLNDRPQDAAARMTLAEIYLRQGKGRQAEAVLMAPGAAPGADPEGLALMARVQERMGRKAELAETLERMLQLDPGNPGLVRKRGLLLLELNRPGEARPLLEQALADDPQDASLTLAVAEASLAQDDAEAAEGHLRALLQREPGHTEGRRRMIDLLLRTERWEEAAARLETWVAEHPRDGAARYNLVTAYLKAFDTEAARPHYEALRELNPRRARPLEPYFR